MRIRYVATLLATIVLVAGCSGSNEDVGPTNTASGNGAPPPPPAGVGSFKALFVAVGSGATPQVGVVPYPTDLYFLGSTDGTLNISASTIFPQRVGMNALDGFSTTASSYFRFSQPLKNDATMLNSNVRIIRAQMLRTSSGAYAPIGVLGVLTPGVDYSVRVSPDVDTGGAMAEIVWLKPLAASSGTGLGNGYIVLVSSGMLNNSNTAATPDKDYLTVRNEVLTELGRAVASGNPATFVPTCPGITNALLNQLCQLTYAHLAIGSNPALGPAAVNPANVILSYSFTTQSTRDALVLMSQTHTAQPIAAVPIGKTTADLLPPGASPGYAAAYAGSLQVPYYLTPPPANYAAPNSACALVTAAGAVNTANPLTVPWTAAGASTVPGIAASPYITRFNLEPAKKADLTIPMLVFKPSGASPSGGVKPLNGWPVVIFMHGVTRNRTDAAAIADAYASQGFVVVAIDEVLHGITDKANALYAGAANPAYALLYPAGTRERTFDIDCLTLAGAVPQPVPDGVTDPSGFDTIVIGTAVGLVQRDIFRQTGSDLITLVKSVGNLDLDGIPGGDIDTSQIHYAGQSLGGIVGPACVCSDVKSFYLNVAGGPYASIGSTSPSFKPVVDGLLAFFSPLLQPGTAFYSQYFRESLALIDAGDPTNYVKQLAMDRPVVFTKVVGDATVPNPTNDYLINAAGATKITAAGLNPVAAGAPKFVTFLNGSHGSLLDPTSSLAVTQEMQTEAASLVATGGTAVQVVNSALLQQ